MSWNCEMFNSKLYEYLDGELSAADTACFLLHIENCPECAQALKEAEAFEAEMAKAFTPVNPPVDFCDRVMAALPKTESVPTPAKVVKFPTKRLLGGVGTIAAAAVLVWGFAIADLDKDQQVPSVSGNYTPVIADLGRNHLTWQEPFTTNDPTTDVPQVQIADNNQQPETKDNADATKKPVGNTVAPPKVDNKPNGNQNTGKEEVGTTSLPKAAFSTKSEGVLAMRMVANFPKENIYMPDLISSDNKLIFNTINESQVYLWQLDLSEPKEPECLGVASNLKPEDVTAAATTNCPTYDTNTALFSPDKSFLAMNLRGEETGVWVATQDKNSKPWRLTGEGGGNLLSWAPNSSKLLFTDVDGKLYVGYPIENRIFLVTDYKVLDLCWGSDSKTVAIVVQEPGKDTTSLYTATIP